MENIFENRANKNKIEKLCPGIYDVREEDMNKAYIIMKI